MTTITKEWLQQTIAEFENTRDDIPFGLSDDDAKILLVLKRALASFEAEPIGAFHIADQQVSGTSDYIKDGEWPIDNGVIEVYAAPPASVTGIYDDVLNIIGLLENNEWAEHCTSTVLGSLLESEITRLVSKERSAPVVPEEITDESTEQRLMGRRWAHSFCAGWNACRAAMLAAAPKPETNNE